jgi:MFS transporter, DHA1 family, multidrug resistance protein
MLAQSDKVTSDIANIMNRRWLFLVILTLMSTAGLVGSDVYLPSLPEMGIVFQRSPHDMQLTLGVYLFGLSTGQLILGPLTDRYGRKRLLIIGMAIYCLASIFCIWTHSYIYILIWRFAQALGACSGLIIGRAIVGDLFDAKEAGKIFSTIFPFVGMSPAISPVIGGFISYYYGWQSTFIFVALFALCVSLLVTRYMPETHSSHKQVSLGFLKIFSRYLQLLINPKFISYAIAPCAAYFAYFAYIAQSPFIFHAQGFGEREIGTFYITLSLAYVAGNLSGKRLLSYFNLGSVIGIGYAIFNIGALLLLITGFENLPLTIMVFSVSVLAFGNGLLIPLGTAGVISSFPGSTGYASGMLGFLQLGLAALSAAIVSVLTHNTILNLGVYMLVVTLSGTTIFYAFKKIVEVK